MHLNRLSTAALMRLTILASLNLLLGRFVGDDWLLHPVFFLSLVTLNLGLYALMVYSGTLNKTLIAMMAVGLAGVLGVIACQSLRVWEFTFLGSFRPLARRIEEVTRGVIELFPDAGFTPPSRQFWGWHGVEVAYIVVDAIGLAAILAAGGLASALQTRLRHRETATTSPPLDAGAASPL
jgi:hypothetical protein